MSQTDYWLMVIHNDLRDLMWVAAMFGFAYWLDLMVRRRR